MEFTKPLIIIYAGDGTCEMLTEVKAGIEEEGALCQVQRCDLGDTREMAYRAAKRSVLGIGIGVTQEGVCVHCKELERDNPLFEIKKYNRDALRIMGINAARYAKGLPFKILEN